MSTQALDASEFAALDALLAGALDQDAATREAWLRERCADAPHRLARVRELLRRAESLPDWERQLADDVSAQSLLVDAMATDDTKPPSACGAWHLLERIGRGGMAEVWLGERHAAGFVQRAAIKLLDGEGPALVARFEQERRILAQLDEPRIARLLDGGVADDGRPWLAMEYVDGARIDNWCDAHRLDLPARIRLLREVAVAAHGAHRALVVHRDIKPANVLVTAQGQVKLLDFGIARLLDPDKPESAAATRTNARALTPQYASPEQLLGEPVTTASDVYQLGLLMVELLAGVRPFQTRTGNLIDLAHAVVNEDPPAPSQALTRAGLGSDELDALLRARRSTLPRLRRQLRGDLDAIALRALARVPTARYASAQAFADDLDAWLSQRPVRARPPSRGYRLRRFVTRNWVASIVGAVLAVVLAAYVGTVLVQAQHIRREAELNRLVRDYLVELLREADPLRTRSPQPSAQRLVDEGVTRARERFANQPDLLAEVLAIGAEVQLGRGNYPLAGTLLAEAVAMRDALDPADPRLTGLLANYGRALHYTAQYDKSEAVLRDAERRWYAAGVNGYAAVPVMLADVLHSRGKYAEAEAVLRRADATMQTVGTTPGARAEITRDLGGVLRDSGFLDEALRLQEGALADMLAVLGERHGSTAATQATLARTQAFSGNAARARSLAIAAMATQAEFYGQHQSVLGMSRQTLALADELDGRYDDALAKLDMVLALDYEAIAPGNVLPPYALLDRAWSRLALGRDDEATADLDLAEPPLRAVRDGGHPRVADIQLARAVIALRRHDRDGARAALDLAVRLRERQFGAVHPATAVVRRWRHALDAPAASTASVTPVTLEARRMRLLAEAAAAN